MEKILCKAFFLRHQLAFFFVLCCFSILSFTSQYKRRIKIFVLENFPLLHSSEIEKAFSPFAKTELRTIESRSSECRLVQMLMGDCCWNFIATRSGRRKSICRKIFPGEMFCDCNQQVV